MSARHTILFLGTPDFAAQTLDALAQDARFEVTLAVSQPDKPVGRGREILSTPVKKMAEAHHIPVFQPLKINQELPAYLEAHHIERPDFLVVVAYGNILKQTILDLPRIAPVNVHASLLPRWRGASPIEHAILAGDTTSGISIQRMVLSLDAGPVLAEETLMIAAEETAQTLRTRLSSVAARLLPATLALPLQETPQNEANVTLCGKLSREDGIVDPSTMTTEEIDRRVRAFVPWPGVTCTIKGQTVKLLKASRTETADSFPLPCKEGTLYLVSVQTAGKRAMSGRDFGNGLRNTAKGK